MLSRSRKYTDPKMPFGIFSKVAGTKIAIARWVKAHARYGTILGNRSLVVYQTDKESVGAGWKFTTMVLPETL